MFGGRPPYPKRNNKSSNKSLAADEANVLPERRNQLNRITREMKHENDFFSSCHSKTSATVIT